MIVLEQVKKNYQDFTLDCSLEVPEGCVTGLVGRNGAGKSTAFKSALGLIGIDGGSARVFGKPAAELTKADREQMGVVLSNAGFSEYLKVRDLVPVLRNMYHSFDEAGFLKKCGKLRIPLDKQMKDFSTGMRQKLQITAALSHNARLLILDEPTAGLDVVTREFLLDMLSSVPSPFSHQNQFINPAVFNHRIRIIFLIKPLLASQAAVSVILFFLRQQIALIQFLILLRRHFQYPIAAEQNIRILMQDNLSVVNQVNIVAEGFKIGRNMRADQDRSALPPRHPPDPLLPR